MTPGDVDAGKKGALEGRWTIAFLDESGANLEPLVGRTWAPRGTVPVLRHAMGRWTRVHMMSAVTHTGRLYFHFRVGRAFRQPDLIRFLRRLERHIDGEVVVFLDRGGPHRGPLLRKFLRSHPRIRLEYLPPYGFEYNPDEGVWDELKWVRLRNFVPTDTEELESALRRGLRRLQHRPGRIAAFFRASKLPREDVELLLTQVGCL